MKKIRDYWEPKYTGWLLFAMSVLIGGCVVLIVMGNLGAILGGGTRFLGWVYHVLAGFVGGFVIAYLLLGVVVWLQKLFMRIPFFSKREGLARGIAIALTYLIIFAAVFGILFTLVFAITKQVMRVDFRELPELLQTIEIQIVGLFDAFVGALEKIGIASEKTRAWLNEIKKVLINSISSAGGNVVGIAGSFGGLMSNILFAVIFSVYFLLETDGLLAYWSDAFAAIIGKRAHGVCATLIHDADKCFAGYIRGQLADAAFMGVAASILLSLVGVPYAVVIGIASGIGNLIPYVGPVVAYGMTIIVCIVNGQWMTLVIALIAILILQTIDGNVINPKLLSQSIDVHPVLVIVGLLFGSAIGGLLGMLLAVPVAGFLKIQFERFVAWRKSKG